MARKRFNPLEYLPSEARLRQLEIVAQRLVESLLAGNYRAVFKGTGIEFDEVREYVEGDDTRLIDWNVSSRFGQVYTKTFREEREMTLFLVLDLSASLNFGGMHPVTHRPRSFWQQAPKRIFGFDLRRLGSCQINLAPRCFLWVAAQCSPVFLPC